MIDHFTENSLYYLIGLAFLLGVMLIMVGLSDRKKAKVVKKDENKDRKKAELELDVVLKSMEESAPIKKALSFEQEQEENAIISYQELLEAARGKIDDAYRPVREEVDPLVQQALNEIEEDIETPYEVANETVIENIEEPVIEEKPEEQKKFKNSEFISPIFGKDNNNNNNVFDSNDEFLAALKSFRRSL